MLRHLGHVKRLRPRAPRFPRSAVVPLNSQPSTLNPLLNLISFSLWGNNPKYLRGAVANARLAPKFYPGWKAVFYLSPEIPDSLRTELLEAGAILRDPPEGMTRGMFWRFCAIDEPDCHRMIVRDADSRPIDRDVRAVDAWVASGKPFHVIRDHPGHRRRLILGGAWGAAKLTPHLPHLTSLIGRHASGPHSYGLDETWLANHLWPIAQRLGVFEQDIGKGTFPICGPRFVGETYCAADRPHPDYSRERLDWASPADPHAHRPAPIVLITQRATSPHPARQREYDYCRQSNRAARWFTHVEVDGRPTFRQHFARASADFPGRVVIIANSDIHFDPTIAAVTRLPARQLLAVTRRDPLSSSDAWAAGSQDAWIFRTPVPDLDCDFPLGVPGCDNRIARLFHDIGWTVINPSHSIRIHHRHASSIRTYTAADKVPGPYHYPVPQPWAPR